MLPANARVHRQTRSARPAASAVTNRQGALLLHPGACRARCAACSTRQLIPRLLKLGGITGVTRLKRFHSFGIGESRAPTTCWPTNGGLPERLAASSWVSRRTIRSSRPKLAAHGDNEADLLARAGGRSKPRWRKRLGNFIIAEDDQTLEGVILAACWRRGQTRCRRRRCSAAAISRAPPGAARRRRGARFRRGGRGARHTGEASGSIGVSTEKPQKSVGRTSAQGQAAPSHALALLIGARRWRRPSRLRRHDSASASPTTQGHGSRAQATPDRRGRETGWRRRRPSSSAWTGLRRHLPRPAGRRAHRLSKRR